MFVKEKTKGQIQKVHISYALILGECKELYSGITHLSQVLKKI